MLESSIPTKIVLPFGSSAGTQYITNPIPVPSQIGITTNAASFTDGFPPSTFQAGGAPRGSDFNGLMNMITAWCRWQAAGGPVYYDSAFSASIGGYPSGTVLSSVATVGNYWISTIDNNTSNPDTGGANWLSATMTPSGRLLNVQQFTTAGTSTYTPTAKTTSIIVYGVGGGGGGGGCPAPGAGYGALGGAGAAGYGGVSRYTTGFSSGLTVTIGAGGSAGAAGSHAGGSGGASSFGGLMSLPGGPGGVAGGAASGAGQFNAGYPTQATGATGINMYGDPGINFTGVAQAGYVSAGNGGRSIFGSGGDPGTTIGGAAGVAPGSGAVGGKSQSASAEPGGVGAPGAFFVYEYS